MSSTISSVRPSPTTGASATSAPDSGPSAGRADRGGLDVRPRVVRKIAAHSARSVPGVVSGSQAGDTSLDAMVGRDLPRVAVDLAARRATVTVAIAVAWPRPAQEVAAEVRRRVAADLRRLSGVPVARVHVDVVKMVASRGRDAP